LSSQEKKQGAGFEDKQAQESLESTLPMIKSQTQYSRLFDAALEAVEKMKKDVKN
jgi:hypothetical protein